MTLWFLIVLLIGFDLSQEINNNKTITLTESSTITCFSNMFTLQTLSWLSSTYNKPDGSSESFIQVDYTIRPTIYSNQQASDVFTKCLQYIIFQSQMVDKTIRHSPLIEKYQLKSTDNASSLSYKFANESSDSNSNYFIAYGYVIGYQQKEPFSNIVYAGVRVNSTMCFEEFGDFNWITNTYINGSYLIEWSELSPIKAPFVCYYELSLKYANESAPRVYRTSTRYFRGIVTAKYPFKLDVQLTAVNNYMCYAETTFPEFDDCTFVYNTSNIFSFKTGTNSFVLNSSTHYRSSQKSSLQVQLILVLIFINKLF
jgi:hypothetical protein